MKIGVFTFATGYSAPVAELGQRLEADGFDALFLPEHSHIPTSRESPWPGGPNLPREYTQTLDPFVALAAVAATTTRLRLGLGVCLVMQRDPIYLAKQVASLDHLSGGRVELGVGGGWNREEMRNHGTDPKQRWAILRERVLAAKEIWAQDEAEFHGEHVDFDPIWCWPKPVGDVPIVVGGDGAGTFDRVLDYGDAWMPLNRGGNTDRLLSRIAELHKLAAERGRPPVPVTIFGAEPSAEAVAGYAAAGVDRLLFRLTSDPMAELEPQLDQIRAAAGDHLGA